MSLQLVVVSGPDLGRVFTLQPGPDLMLGRSAQAYYRLDDPRVSRNHCELIREGDVVTVVCNGGSGGTLVNGKPTQRKVLKPGDVLQVGDTSLRLQIGDLPVDVALAHAASARADAGQARPNKLEALAGTKLGHFDIGPVLGTGSTSMVFHATDTRDQRSVALKVLLPEFAQDETEVERFVRAMKTVMPLRHPNLITVFGAGKTGPHCWVAMEYVAGENMTEVIRRIGVAGMLDWRYAYKTAVHVARALAYAHERQIIHRDVTPKNVLLEATTKAVKLGDLMKAKALEGALAKQITRRDELVGEVTYMSPERTRGSLDVDARSDVYGVGATCYALLTGRPPFDGATLVEKITRIRQDEPVKPTKYQMSIPAAFEGVVLRAIAKRPEDRYQSAAELLEELERVGRYSGAKA